MLIKAGKKIAILASTIVLLLGGLTANAEEVYYQAPTGYEEEVDAEPEYQRRHISPRGNYFTDRFHDFLDIFRFRAGFPESGKAIGLKVRATSAAQLGYVYFEGQYAGLDRRAIGVVDERRIEGGISFLYGSMNEMIPSRGNSFLMPNSDWNAIKDRRILRNLPHWDDGRLRHLSIGAEVATPLFALDVGIYPEEILDFVVGFTTLDIFKDDERSMRTPRYFYPTTPPGPDSAAPFRQRQRDMDALNAQLIREELERMNRKSQQNGQDADSMEWEYNAPLYDTEESRISDEAADEAMRRLEELNREVEPVEEETPETSPEEPNEEVEESDSENGNETTSTNRRRLRPSIPSPVIEDRD